MLAAQLRLSVSIDIVDRPMFRGRNKMRKEDGILHDVFVFGGEAAFYKEYYAPFLTAWHAVPKDMPAGRPRKTPISALTLGLAGPSHATLLRKRSKKKIIEAREIVGGNRWLEI
eukprot:jgi/Chlat1/5423/Chrsp35S05314